MKLWLLRAIQELVDELEPPFECEYDQAEGFVVRADTEEMARSLASERAGFEEPVAWLTPEFTTCIELSQDGPAGVVLRDFHHG